MRHTGSCFCVNSGSQPRGSPACIIKDIPQSFWSQNPPSKVTGWGVQKPRLPLSPGQNWRSPLALHSRSNRGADEKERKKKRCEMFKRPPAKSAPSMGSHLFNWPEGGGRRCFIFISVPDAWSWFLIKAFLKWIMASCLKQNNWTELNLFYHLALSSWTPVTELCCITIMRWRWPKCISLSAFKINETRLLLFFKSCVCFL